MMELLKSRESIVRNESRDIYRVENTEVSRNPSFTHGMVNEKNG